MEGVIFGVFYFGVFLLVLIWILYTGRKGKFTNGESETGEAYQEKSERYDSYYDYYQDAYNYKSQFENSNSENQKGTNSSENYKKKKQVFEVPYGFFRGCSSLEELKALKKVLVKKYHPDNGGSKEMFQRMNNEYEEWVKSLF